MDRRQRTALLERLALDAGFSRFGVAASHDRPSDRGHLQRWIDAGMHGSMAWMARDVQRRSDPGRVVAGARSVIMLALDYDSDAPRSVDPGAVPEGHGWISRYAWGTDYHLVAERRLKALTAAVQEQVAPELGEDFRGAGGEQGPFDARRDFRWYVDYGPLLERRWGEEAGLGWQGKNSLLIDPERGSFFFLAAVVTSIDLEPSEPVVDHCGSCTACIDACPTDAIVADRVVDSRLCISYLTIEVKGDIAESDRERVGSHVFGCDICQDVCPFNRFSRPSGEAEFAPRPGNLAPPLGDLLALDPEAFRERFRRSPVKRRGHGGLRDNVRAALACDERRDGGVGRS